MFNENSNRVSCTLSSPPEKQGNRIFLFTPEHELADYVMSGFLPEGFYLQAETGRLAHLNRLCEKVSDLYLAKLALYCFRTGGMTDLPAYFLALLTVRNLRLSEKLFPFLITNGQMLRSFTRIIRSGIMGRRSFGTSLVRLIGNWLNALSDSALLALYIGKNPALRDILRLVHPKPQTAEREAFYGWICQNGGRYLHYDPQNLPPLLQKLEAFFKKESLELPASIPHALLITKTGYTQSQWAAVLKHCSWNELRLSLNLFYRNGVFDQPETIAFAVDKLTNPEEIKTAPVTPQTLYKTLAHLDKNLPSKLVRALHQALEQLAAVHLPDFNGKTLLLCPFVSPPSASAEDRTQNRAKPSPADLMAFAAAMILKGNPQTSALLPLDGQKPMIFDPQIGLFPLMARLKTYFCASKEKNASFAACQELQQQPDIFLFFSEGNPAEMSQTAQCPPSLSEVPIWKEASLRAQGSAVVSWNIAAKKQAEKHMAENILYLNGFSETVFPAMRHFAALTPAEKSPAQQAAQHVAKIEQIQL